MLTRFSFQAEFLSVCEKRHKFVLLNGWRRVDVPDNFNHLGCDFCNFEAGLFASQLSFLLTTNLIAHNKGV
jgi:hypothetical protein